MDNRENVMIPLFSFLFLLLLSLLSIFSFETGIRRKSTDIKLLDCLQLSSFSLHPFLSFFEREEEKEIEKKKKKKKRKTCSLPYFLSTRCDVQFSPFLVVELSLQKNSLSFSSFLVLELVPQERERERKKKKEQVTRFRSHVNN